MIDLLEQHLAHLKMQTQEPELAVAGIRPYLRPGMGSPELRDQLLEIPLRIPDLLRALSRVIATSDDPRIRGFAGGIYAYVFNPIDIIPEEDLGYVGFVEDAIICWRGLKTLVEHYGVAQMPEVAGYEDSMMVAWHALSDEVQAAINGFFMQFELTLAGLKLAGQDS